MRMRSGTTGLTLNLTMTRVGLRAPLKGDQTNKQVQRKNQDKDMTHLSCITSFSAWLRQPGPMMLPKWVWAFVFICAFIGCPLLMQLDSIDKCAGLVQDHPVESLREVLYKTCKDNMKEQNVAIYCDHEGTLLVKMKALINTEQVLDWTKQCTDNAKRTFENQDKQGNNCSNVLFYDLSNVTVPISSEGHGTRRRRSLVEGHEPHGNKWLTLARYTASKINITTPCWVCAFRPHHSGETPQSIPLPVSVIETVCLLGQPIWAGFKFSLPGCDSFSNYSTWKEWVTPVNWTTVTNQTTEQKLRFAGMSYFRNQLTASMCFSRNCSEGDRHLGRSRCVHILGQGFAEQGKSWTDRMTEMRTNLVNQTEPADQIYILWGGRWPLNGMWECF